MPKRIQQTLMSLICVGCISVAAQPHPSATPTPPASIAPLMTEAERQQVSFGTGFSIGNGFILTAHHVVKNLNKVLVGSVQTGKWVSSDVVKIDAVLDLALIKTSLEVPPLELARSDKVPMGLEISVIGFPQPKIQGLTPKITQGIINGYPNLKQQAEDRGYFQISADISQGNSGGPLIGPDGSVIGMVQRKLSSQRVLERTQEWTVNVGFALRSSHILGFLEGTTATVQVKPLDTQTLLRPFQIFEKVNPSVVSIIARTEPVNK
jgi:S1-C subfamily serine protease